MPSTLHEALVSLFHNDPRLAPDLLRTVLGVSLPEQAAEASVHLEDPTLNQASPTEYRADAVVVLRDAGQRPVHAVVVEIQLSEDGDKSFAWPVYATTLRARLRCPVALLVVTPYADVAAWAAEPIGIGSASTFVPHVVGPDLLPTAMTPSEARERPELAVLSVLAHGEERGAAALAAAAVHAIADLDADRAMLYCDLVLSALSDAARAGIEELMKTKYEYQSDFAKMYISRGREEGREEGRRAGARETLQRLVRRHLNRFGVQLDEGLAAGLDAATLESLERIEEELTATSDPAEIEDVIRWHVDGTDNGS